jgi:cytosine/adenosine deaminase-related metal-dependent hydrolase
MLGPDARAERQTLARLAALPDVVAATPHALYSTTPAIIKAISQRAARLGHPVSLHLAESADEIALLRLGNGCFRSFLAERGSWDGSLALPAAGLTRKEHGAVAYLERLGLLHSRLLCVHCVQVSEDEVRLLARHECKVCLCPGSNRFLRVGRAPLEMMLQHGLLPAIGTDSIASNEGLDLWREMQILREDHPQVAPAQILKMATLGGAEALDRARDYGSLAPGRSSILLNVDDPALSAAWDGEQLLDLLTRLGRPARLRWIGDDDL